MTGTFHHMVKFPFADGTPLELPLAWCNENLGGQGGHWCFYIDMEAEVTVFAFADVRDAILFKLAML